MLPRCLFLPRPTLAEMLSFVVDRSGLCKLWSVPDCNLLHTLRGKLESCLNLCLRHSASSAEQQNSAWHSDPGHTRLILDLFWLGLVSPTPRLEGTTPTSFISSPAPTGILQPSSLYLFTFRARGREGEREGNTNVWEIRSSVARHTPPTWGLAHNPGLCPDWELNRWPFGLQAIPNPLSHTSQGCFAFC